uniref:Glycoside hydrolase family 5 domain-containing protein n=1 Tax=uncultured bacterium contig00069 TaxID=1181550 RepID=A0A806JZN8_9BACT|nr:putative protein-signal peptide [uncultured bacterium contig00069]
MKKIFPVLCLLAAGSVFAQSPPAQTTQDYAEGNRLIINGKPLFISGINVAWKNFAGDVGDQALSASDRNWFGAQFSEIKNAGGNAVRWWLHTDAQNCPKINSNGQVTGIGSNTINNIRTVLDSAYKYGIVVSLTLFSFDLLQQESKSSYSSYNIDNNYKFLTVAANIDTYIENALKPILAAVGNHPAIMCWEVFNEPEGMSTGNGANGWSTQRIPHDNVLRITNKIAGVVHRETKKMASTGIHNFHQYRGVYSDASLRTAGGDQDGYLDFYMAHTYPEYESNLSTQNPFSQPASYWGFDRPVLIGEFPAQSWGSGGYPYGGNRNINDLYEYAYNNGYCGLMSWSITEGDVSKFGNLSTTKPALTYMYNKYKNDIDISLATPASSSSARSSSSIALSSSSSSNRSSSSSLAASSSSSSRSSSSSLAASSSSSSRASSSSVAAISSSSRFSSSSISSSSSSSLATPSSSSSLVIGSSSSSEEATPILSNPQSLVPSPNEIRYYNLKGEPLGTQKPTMPGVYLVKNTKTGQVQKVAVK